MRLVAGTRTMFMSPIRPLTGEVLLKQFGKSLAVIGNYTAGSFRTFLRKELGKVFLQFVATTAGELFKQVVRPVGTINLVRVIKEIVGICRRRSGRTIGCLSGKGTFKTSQIVGDGFRGEVIHHISFSTGGRAFHFLECLPYESGNQLPFSFRSFPVQFSVYEF